MTPRFTCRSTTRKSPTSRPASFELEDPADARVLVVANPSDAGTTVNLLAPVIVNTRTWQCAQVILEGRDLPLRAPLEAVAAA